MTQRARSWLDAVPAGTPEETARLQALQAAGLPDERNEHWAHAHLRAFADVRQLAPVPAGGAAAFSVAGNLPAALDGAARLVLVDGQLLPGLSDATAAMMMLGSDSPWLVCERNSRMPASSGRKR